MIKLKEWKEFHMRERLFNMKKLQELKEFQSKELSLTIMQFKLKLNIFLNKLKRLLSNMNQLRGHGKEFNIYPLKPKLFTTQRDKNKLSVKEEDILKQVKHTFTKQTLSTLEPSTLEDSQQEDPISKAVISTQCLSQPSKEDILAEA